MLNIFNYDYKIKGYYIVIINKKYKFDFTDNLKVSLTRLLSITDSVILYFFWNVCLKTKEFNDLQKHLSKKSLLNKCEADEIIREIRKLRLNEYFLTKYRNNIFMDEIEYTNHQIENQKSYIKNYKSIVKF